MTPWKPPEERAERPVEDRGAPAQGLKRPLIATISAVYLWATSLLRPASVVVAGAELETMVVVLAMGLVIAGVGVALWKGNGTAYRMLLIFLVLSSLSHLGYVFLGSDDRGPRYHGLSSALMAAWALLLLRPKVRAFYAR